MFRYVIYNTFASVACLIIEELFLVVRIFYIDELVYAVIRIICCASQLLFYGAVAVAVISVSVLRQNFSAEINVQFYKVLIRIVAV